MSVHVRALPPPIETMIQMQPAYLHVISIMTQNFYMLLLSDMLERDCLSSGLWMNIYDQMRCHSAGYYFLKCFSI